MFFRTASDGVLTRSKVPIYMSLSVIDAFNGDTSAEQSEAQRSSGDDEGHGMSRDQAVNYDRSDALEKIAAARTNVPSPRPSQGDAKRQRIHGINSSDSKATQEARKKLKSALKNGYHGLRYELDIQCRARMLENGKATQDMLRVELSSSLVLASPKLTFAQRQLGVGAASTSENLVVRLAYIKTELCFLLEPLGSELRSRWILMLQTTPWSWTRENRARSWAATD